MPWGTCEESISGGSAFSMIWSHCGFQGVPPSSTFFSSMGVGGAGLVACARKPVAIPMKNMRLTMNDVFSAEILMLTSLRYLQGSALSFPVQHPCLFGRNRAIGPAFVGQHRHAILRAFVAVFRTVRGFFRAAAAVFLALPAALTGDSGSSLGCFAVRWWPWCSGWMRAASASIRR